MEKKDVGRGDSPLQNLCIARGQWTVADIGELMVDVVFANWKKGFESC